MSPTRAGEIGDAVTAVRLATSGAIAAGPVLFERLDWRPFGIKPMLPIAAAQPGERRRASTRSAAGSRPSCSSGLPLADEDPELGEALDRWELSLFQSGSSREEQLREALTALLGGMDGVWAATMRASVLLGDRLDEPRPDSVRRAIVETLMHGDRPGLVLALDDAMLGLREAPAGYFARATA